MASVASVASAPGDTSPGIALCWTCSCQAAKSPHEAGQRQGKKKGEHVFEYVLKCVFNMCLQFLKFSDVMR